MTYSITDLNSGSKRTPGNSQGVQLVYEMIILLEANIWLWPAHIHLLENKDMYCAKCKNYLQQCTYPQVQSRDQIVGSALSMLLKSCCANMQDIVYKSSHP
jgi:hypothetical protein